MASFSSSRILSASVLGAFSFFFCLQSVAANVLTQIDYSPQQVSQNGDTISIKMDQEAGSRVRSNKRYAYGTFSAWVKCAAGDTSGFVSSFYTSSLEGSSDQDEIDFEWLGNDKYAVQTNYYVNHQGGREELVQLGFDCSKAFHKYTIKWSSSSIKWYVDNQLVRTATNDGSAYPTKPSYLYSSIWDASDVNGGAWAGTASYSDAPYYFQIKGASAS